MDAGFRRGERMQKIREAEPAEMPAIQQSLFEEAPALIGSAVDADGKPVTDEVRFVSLDRDGLVVLVAGGCPLATYLRHRRYLSCMGRLEKAEGHPLVGFSGRVHELAESDARERISSVPAFADLAERIKAEGLAAFILFDGKGLWRTEEEELAFPVGQELPQVNYYVTNSCTGCAICVAACPQLCIDMTKSPVVINQVSCIHCGTCYEKCPYHAIVKL